jgi:hypothetical protein
MGKNNFRKAKFRLEYTHQRLKALFTVLAAVLIVVSLLMAVVIFVYLLRATLYPSSIKALVDEWALLLMDTVQDQDSILKPTEGPARWFAVIALLVLGFLLSRLPILLLQMGTSLFAAAQDHQRQTKLILKEVLRELKAEEPFLSAEPLDSSGPENSAPPEVASPPAVQDSESTG